MFLLVIMSNLVRDFRDCLNFFLKNYFLVKKDGKNGVFENDVLSYSLRI